MGLLFLLAMFFSPIAGIVPASATAPALIIVGYLMMATLTQGEAMAQDEEEGHGLVKRAIAAIDFSDIAFGIPAVLIMTIMPLTYSITNGIGFGFISYTLIRIFQGRPGRSAGCCGSRAPASSSTSSSRCCRPRAGSEPRLGPAAARSQPLAVASASPALEERGGPPKAARPVCVSFAPVTYAYLILALGLILVSAELFTNGVEWLGRRYDLGEGAVGSILAAVGTALPETLVPIIAIIFTGGAAARDVGMGAILGAPFMLSSLAMLVTGAAVVIFWLRGRRSRDVMVNEPVMRRDLSHFLIAYSLAMVAGLLHVQLLNWLLARHAAGRSTATTCGRPCTARATSSEDTKPLYFHRHPVMPHRYRIFLQIGVAVAGIIIGAQVFVDQVQTLSVTLGASPLLISLLVTPIATELPEKFNSVLWVRQRKDTLALGNITGAMVFQSTFPVSVGLIFTTWHLNQTGLVSGVLALVSGTVFYLTLRLRHRLTWWSLGGAGSMYIVYLVYVFRAQVRAGAGPLRGPAPPSPPVTWRW